MAEKSRFVILAVTKVGSMHANNTCPANFIAINVQIKTNTINSYRHDVQKLISLEDMLLTIPVEPTNKWYFVAKFVGIKMC